MEGSDPEIALLKDPLEVAFCQHPLFQQKDFLGKKRVAKPKNCIVPPDLIRKSACFCYRVFVFKSLKIYDSRTIPCELGGKTFAAPSFLLPHPYKFLANAIWSIADSVPTPPSDVLYQFSRRFLTDSSA